MARLARAEVFSPDEVAVVHVMNRVVRRCFLLGTDAVTGKNFDHRKVWIEELLERQAAAFGIDLLGFAILSNHFHLILRSRPDVVKTWSDTEVARRWLLLCPVRKDDEGNAEEPNEVELNGIRNDRQKLATIRLRLSDVAWWMRLLCQHIAVRANREDKEVGKFWQSRFRAVRLLDETAILACAAYVDLNPIRAGIAKSLETSDHTSIQRRIESTKSKKNAPSQKAAVKKASSGPEPPPTRDSILAPLPLNERSGPIGPVPSRTPGRCSDKGFIPLTLDQYVEVLNWTARQLPRLKRGWSIQDAPLAFTACPLTPTVWCQLVREFGKLFCQVAGQAQTVDTTRSRIGQNRYYLKRPARDLLTSDAS